jgi:ADP-ribosyltransferase exoenzyme
MANGLGNIPTLDAVNPGAVENAASGISKAGSGIRHAGAELVSAWSKLHGVYHAPEAGELIGAINPIRDQADRFGWEVGQVGAALSDYAAEIAPVKAKLVALKAAAGVMLMAQAATPGGESHWRRKQSNVDAENKLLHDVAVALNEAHQIAAKCANRINGLIGGVQYHGGAAPAGTPDAYWANDPSHLSWALPVKKDDPWWKDGLNGALGFGKGVVIDGGWGLIKGVGYMAGFGPKGWDWHNVWNSYKAIETLGAPLVLPGAVALPSVRKAWVTTGKDFIALSEWKKDKGRAAGKVVFNIVTLGVPETRLGMAGKAGDAALAVTRGVNKVDVVGHGLNFGIRAGAKGVSAGLDAMKTLRLGEGLTHLPKIRVHGLDRLPDAPAPKIDPGHFDPGEPKLPGTGHDVPHPKPTVRQVADHVESKYQHDLQHLDQPRHESVKAGGGHSASAGAHPHEPSDIKAHGGRNGNVADPPRTHAGRNAVSGGHRDPVASGGGHHPGSGTGGHHGGGGHPPGHGPSSGHDPFQQGDHGQGHDPGHQQTPGGHHPHVSSDALAHDPNVPGEVKDGVRHFAANHDGEVYGEKYLAGTYRHLPPEQRHAIREYTRHSWPYNTIKRLNSTVEREAQLRSWWNHVGPGWDMFEMNGGKTPTLDDIAAASHRTDLTPMQRHIVDDIQSALEPKKRLNDWIHNSGARGMLTRTFGHFPTLDDIYSRMNHMDQALSHPLPEGVQVQRGLKDVDFIQNFDPHDPHGYKALIGKTHTEPGYTSTSLGSDAAFKERFRLHLDVPKGSNGLWLGKKSVYPDQRELILPPGTKYRITGVTVGRDGKIDIIAKVIP